MMSNSFGGGGRGGGRNSSGRGRGGRYHSSNGYQGRGGGRGGSHGGGGRGADGPKKYHGKLSPCADFTSKGTCKFGDKCHYSHALKLHAVVDASTIMPQQQQQQQQQQHHSHQQNKGFYNQQQQQQPESYAVSSIGIWDQTNQPAAQAPFKIFTGSHDGFWRLWNPSANFQKEFEHYMGPPKPPQATLGTSTNSNEQDDPPKVHNIQITNNHMFVAFDAPCAKIPGSIRVGMVHAWNLASPQDPPMEFHIETSNDFSPFAHAGGVSSLMIQPDGLAFSGGKDCLIRCWSMIDVPAGAPATPGAPPPASPAPNGGTKKVFAVSKLLAGHAREVTALARATPTDPILWSGSTDGTMRLWDIASGKCQYMISGDTAGPNGTPGQPQPVGSAPAGGGVGHTGAITSLLTWDFGNNQHFILSSSLDGSIRAWSTKAECMANSIAVDQAAEQQQQAAPSQHPPQGVVCMALHKDLKQNPLLLCGMLYGDVCIRTLSQQSPTVPAFTLIVTVSGFFLNCGHNQSASDRYYRTAIRCITDGPSQTFYSGGEDGKMCVWQIVGDFNLR